MTRMCFHDNADARLVPCALCAMVRNQIIMANFLERLMKVSTKLELITTDGKESHAGVVSTAGNGMLSVGCEDGRSSDERWRCFNGA